MKAREWQLVVIKDLVVLFCKSNITGALAKFYLNDLVTFYLSTLPPEVSIGFGIHFSRGVLPWAVKNSCCITLPEAGADQG